MAHLPTDVLAITGTAGPATVVAANKKAEIPPDPFKLAHRNLLGDFTETRNAARRLILIVTLLSLVADIALITIGLALAIQRGSAAIYAFSAECFLDLVSSVIILWQFQGKSTKQKERLACNFLGVLFVISGVGVILKALSGIVHKEHPITVPLLVALSLSGSAVCTCLAILKLWTARRVTLLACGVSAQTITLDAVGSLLSAFCALSALIGPTAYRRRHSLWFLESAMTSLAGFMMVVIGGRVIYQHASIEY